MEGKQTNFRAENFRFIIAFIRFIDTAIVFVFKAFKMVTKLGRLFTTTCYRNHQISEVLY